MIYTTIVGILAIILTFLYDKRINNWGFALAMIILTTFTAIRWEWGNDMSNYLGMFEQIGSTGMDLSHVQQLRDEIAKQHEIGWLMINMICQPIGFFGMTILLSIFEGAIVYWFLKKYVQRGYLTFAVFLYVFNWNMMVLGCSMMRQWLAMCIILLAIPSIIDGKIVRFLIIVYIASLFHTSALLLIPCYFMRIMGDIKFTRSQLISISIFLLLWVFVIGKFASAILSNFLSIDLLNGYSTYDEREFAETNSQTLGFGTFLNCIAILTCLFSTLYTPYASKITILIFIIGYLILLPFTTIILLVFRIAYYFQIIAIVAIPNVIKYTQNKYIRIGIMLWFVLQYTMLFFNAFYDPTWKDAFFEYHTIFEAPYWM